MTKLIAILVILLVIWGGWKLFEYWESVNAKDTKAAAVAKVVPEQLEGMPSAALEPSLAAATLEGASGLKNWLNRYGSSVKDPRLGWIQLDYVVLITKDNPAEAKKIFAQVKSRIKPGNPVYDRIKKLEKTYD